MKTNFDIEIQTHINTKQDKENLIIKLERSLKEKDYNIESLANLVKLKDEEIKAISKKLEDEGERHRIENEKNYAELK